MRRSLSRSTPLVFLLLAAVVLLLAFAGVASAAEPSTVGNWWDVTPEAEVPSSSYDSILYSEIAPRLRQIEMASNRVKVEVIGQSAGGRNLFLVTISEPQALGRLGQYQAIRQAMIRDPEHAQELIDRFGDFKVPVFINGSIHGNEYPGTDAAMRLIEEFAFSNEPGVMNVLENEILLINVCQNPDGRVLGTRANANGIDINRDFITQSQPETRATVGVYTEWNPMIVLDLHGFVNPMLIEPCTPPHNPNYEYDLYIKWALAQAEAMEAELFAQTGFLAQIPYRDDPLEWDDWPPTYAPMYAMFHGAYGHTMETPYRDVRGVDAHYATVWGALNFVAQNRQAMVRDQVEIFRRGFLSLPQQPIPPELLPQWPQYQDVITNHFPAAYVIPADEPLQISPQAPARLVDFLLFNDVQVEKASKGFTLNGVAYPAGTYVVWLNQPKRGLANTILSDGLDLSSI
ncbi:MAG: M14 family zinc carboxypeptidase, partial [Deltaproteobacteria bacterium]